jgi:hypothetical protein
MSTNIHTIEHPALHARVTQLAALVCTPEGRAAVEHVHPASGHVAGVYTADGEADLAAVILADLEHMVGPERLVGVLDLVLRQRCSPEDVEGYARVRA